jgi:ATP-dependent DNA helicase RecQ
MPSAEQTSAPALQALLHRVFGHSGFRPHQKEVCEAAAAGRDVLLVMPTGAGKSLCYQLPALARGASGEHRTCLVISPLIALMDDQAGKLSALGLRVARIHSGLSREDARQACRDYLGGALDFLFIAPERMRVPGFPEMLAKRRPALIAIDEAHCISAWGHDFRPDYRTLGQHLPALRPSPIIALTATATPTVQRDIARQLDLRDPAIFITGFRRDNLSVEVVELSKPQRPDFVAELLADATARPAIVYAASRKDAEEYAARLSQKLSAQAYHAGLPPATREQVQRDFLSGKLDVIVATVAFGMGVDKANVRTVVHVALPGSVEAYYQEIGRAGRDGAPSRTVLLHSFADRRTHEFLLEKSFPATADLERVARSLGEDFRTVDSLQEQMRGGGQPMERETIERSIEKLIAVNVATMDIYGDVRATDAELAVRSAGARGARTAENAAWKAGYEALVNARRDQIDRMAAFAEGHTCRMSALVAHFGDPGTAPCGLCDICLPGASLARTSLGGEGHAPTADERQDLRRILQALDSKSQSTGKLFTELALRKERKDFDRLLDALARAGLLTLANDTFRNPEGKDITYRKAAVTHEGREPDDDTLATVWLTGPAGAIASGRKASAKRSAGARAGTDRSRIPKSSDEPLIPAAEALFKRLRAWRTAEAKPTNTPAYLILSDAVLRAIAMDAPRTLAGLGQIRGLGPAKIDRFGPALLAVCRGDVDDDASTRQAPVRAQKSAPPTKARKAESTSTLRAEARDADRPAVRVSAVREKKTAPPPEARAELTAAQLALEERLKVWRRETARAAGLPSFFIVSDTALRQIAVEVPTSHEALVRIDSLNAQKRSEHGPAILALCLQAS